MKKRKKPKVAKEKELLLPVKAQEEKRLKNEPFNDISEG